MSDDRKLESGHDWQQHGDTIRGSGAAQAVFRGIQADLNYFAERCGFEAVKVDGVLGPRTMDAIKAVHVAVVAKNPMLAATLVPPTTVEATAETAMATRTWLETTARKALGISDLRRYLFGHGKEWNVKDAIAYGAGPVHDDFKKLQADLNHYAEPIGFAPLAVDGFLGPKTAAATKAIYDALVAKNPLNAATLFPVPDTKEECAEYCMFIRDWLGKSARALLPEAGA